MLFFKLLGKRGAAITEYAVLLAFVAVIGTSFTNSDSLEDSMHGFISRVEKTVGVDNNYPGDVGGSGGEGGTEEGGSGGGDNGNTGSGTENGGSGGSDNGNTGGGNTGSGTETPPVTPPDKNFGFAYDEDELEYGALVQDLINYILSDTYNRDGDPIVSAKISGNGNHLDIAYSSGENPVSVKIDLSQVLQGDYDYTVKTANLVFGDNRNLVDDGTNKTSIEVWIKGNSQGNTKETLIMNAQGKLVVDKKVYSSAN